MGWMSNWQYANVVPTLAWRSATTLPREVALLKKENEYELKFKPVIELEKIQGESKSVSGNSKLDHPLSLITFDLNENEKTFFVTLANEGDENITLSLKQGILSFDRRNSGITNFSEVFPAVHKMDLSRINVKKVSLYIDLSSVEIFINDGERVMTEIIFPTKPYDIVKLEKENQQMIISTISSTLK